MADISEDGGSGRKRRRSTSRKLILGANPPESYTAIYFKEDTPLI